jgi:hypothetical protein
VRYVYQTGVLLHDTLEDLKVCLSFAAPFLLSGYSCCAQVGGRQSGREGGWEEEADKIAGNIEKDKVMISAQLSRRVLIRAC